MIYTCQGGRGEIIKHERSRTVTTYYYTCDGCGTGDVWWKSGYYPDSDGEHWCDSCARQRLVESGEYKAPEDIPNLADWYDPLKEVDTDDNG